MFYTEFPDTMEGNMLIMRGIYIKIRTKNNETREINRKYKKNLRCYRI